jgi:hypothetical protein
MGDTERMVKYILSLKYLKPTEGHIKDYNSSQCSTEDISNGLKTGDDNSSAISLSGKSLKSDKSGLTGGTPNPQKAKKRAKIK